eukprot:IDg9119t1
MSKYTAQPAWAVAVPSSELLQRFGVARGSLYERAPKCYVPRRPRARCSVENLKSRAEPDTGENEVSSPASQNGAVPSVPGTNVSSNSVAATSPSNSVATPKKEIREEDIVRLEDVSLSFGNKRVLHDFNLSIRTGEGTAIIGASGTGKSTTLRLICGLELPDSGRVTLRGWRREQHIREDFGPVKVAMVFQQAALFDSLTVCENVGFELFQHSSLQHERILELVDAALTRVGLRDVMDLYPGQLSGGMRKRVSFARAVMYNPDDRLTMPEIILYDEPSAGLDPTSSTRIENCIRDLQSICPSYIVVTHQLSTIRRTADRVVFLHDGKVQWDGPITDIDTTSNPYVRQFMSASLDGPLDDDRILENNEIGDYNEESWDG